MVSLTPLFVGGMPGGMELAIIVMLVILLFGADKLPKLARSSGQAMGEFRKGREEIEREIRDAATAAERDVESVTEDVFETEADDESAA